ncbi:MAG: type secretion system protein [Thermoleophilia bacterium]|nr:type secretion system protein [Thermoleophilia bacterium]
MLKSAQKATRGEGGFTLIELLVVMIIIAILMAVAVPTFLKQKQNAVATKAKANVKQIVTTIESCASGNTTGSYTAPRNCTLEATLTADEPVMSTLFTPPPGSIEDCTITARGTTGYMVGCVMQGESSPVTFTEDHTATGQVLKNCAPPGGKACPTGLTAGKMW